MTAGTGRTPKGRVARAWPRARRDARADDLLLLAHRRARVFFVFAGLQSARGYIESETISHQVCMKMKKKHKVAIRL